METASNSLSVSKSFREYIERNLGENDEFKQLVDRYSNINLGYQFKTEECPENRRLYREIKDLLWIATSNSKDIDDFSKRIIGLLSHNSHNELISVLKETEIIYDSLIWKTQKQNIERIENQLSGYKSQFEELYFKINKFYGTVWNRQIPIKIMLYPIPLEKGITTATQIGNTLICGFLSKNGKDYIGRLGIIIHEMCHMLFDAQPVELKYNIDDWFIQSNSDFNTLAYTYLDEGLATAIGNGWAYQQIHRKIDTLEWYNDEYINGFTHEIFDIVSDYLSEEKRIDEGFVKLTIEEFAKKFPQAIYETQILLNEMQLCANSEGDKEIKLISSSMRQYFNIRSYGFQHQLMMRRRYNPFTNLEQPNFLSLKKLIMRRSH